MRNLNRTTAQSTCWTAGRLRQRRQAPATIGINSAIVIVFCASHQSSGSSRASLSSLRLEVVDHLPKPGQVAG